MEGIKYLNFSGVIMEIREVENGNLVVPVNNTLVCRMSFLATDTRLCVLMYSIC